MLQKPKASNYDQLCKSANKLCHVSFPEGSGSPGDHKGLKAEKHQKGLKCNLLALLFVHSQVLEENALPPTMCPSALARHRLVDSGYLAFQELSSPSKEAPLLPLWVTKGAAA